MNVREKAIPKELLDKAEAIAVFPDVVKAAFIFGGKGGQGRHQQAHSERLDGAGFFNLSGWELWRADRSDENGLRFVDRE